MILNKYKITNSKVFVNRIQESKNAYLFMRQITTFGFWAAIHGNFTTIRKRKTRMEEKADKKTGNYE